ncbi:MAG TPA: type II toxin-antitoxin system HicA family toxin [Spirochaetes bacterium]|mgnify:CR=1 FL=1|nr:type II toxin-antitoxin system HicA family toxin [Spirochaetota bacterium]
MSQYDKLLKRFLSSVKDFRYKELIKLLSGFGYIENTKGQTRGSRVSFKHKDLKTPIKLHKPHGSKALKEYQISQIKDELIKQGFIDENN